MTKHQLILRRLHLNHLILIASQQSEVSADSAINEAHKMIKEITVQLNNLDTSTQTKCPVCSTWT